MAGTTAQPIHEPPQKRENKQVTFTLKNISGKGGEWLKGTPRDRQCSIKKIDPLDLNQVKDVANNWA